MAVKKFEGEAVRTTILVPPAIHERLTNESKEQCRTVSAQVVYMIVQGLPPEEKDPYR